MRRKLCDTFGAGTEPRPGWWNWQTQRTQNPPTARSWGFDPPSRHHKNQLLTANVFSDQRGDFGYSLAKLQHVCLTPSSKSPSRAPRCPSVTGVAVRLHPAFNLSLARAHLGLEVGRSHVSGCIAPLASTNRFDRNHGRPQAPRCSHPTASAREIPYRHSEEALMADAPIRLQRLLRTKEAAAYLCMSEWKLRRLIQSEIIPIVQDQPGAPFLLDLRDLDAYIESNKHHFGDSDGWRPTPVQLSPSHSALQGVRRVK